MRDRAEDEERLGLPCAVARPRAGSRPCHVEASHGFEPERVIGTATRGSTSDLTQAIELLEGATDG